MIPKVGVAADVYAIDMLITQIEAAQGAQKRISSKSSSRASTALQNVEAIARLQAARCASSASADYAASTGMRTTNIGGPNSDYVVLTDKDDVGQARHHWADLACARPAWWSPAVHTGLRPIDGPFGDFSEADGFSAGKRAAVLGCEGKWAIHPAQSRGQ